MRKLACLIAVIALLLCACTAQVMVNNNTQINATDPSTGESAGQTEPSVSQQTDPTQTTPIVTVPLVPENSDYTGPTLNASESVEEWGDNNGNNNGNTNSTEATKPEETTPPATKPTEPSDSEAISYEDYMAMSTSEQQAYFLSFHDVEAFYVWLDKAEAEYKAAHPEVGGDGNIDIGDYMGNGN